MTASTKKLLVTLVVLIALAVGGAAFYSGYIKKNADAPQEQQLAATDAQPEIDATLEPEATPATEPEATPATDTAAAEGTHSFDLNAALAPRGLGNPGAPIKIIEYASLTCNHCAHFHNDILPDMKAKYIDTGKVYLEFQEFPLNAPALDAALLARCLPAERYESFTGLLFKTQEDWTTRPDYINSLKQNAKLAGLSDEGIEQCLQSNDLRQAIGKNIQTASEKHKIVSTPTFVINDGAEVIRGAMPLDAFEQAFTKISGGAAAPAPTAETPAAAPTPETETPAAGSDEAAPAPEEQPAQ